jgi:hypothetical protein
MSKMGSYCKAYPIERLRSFGGWSENARNTRKESRDVDGREVEVNRVLNEGDYLFLQENYNVTDGVFIDENIIFNEVTEEWKEFCNGALKFEIPDFGGLQVGDGPVAATQESGG